MQVLSDGKLAVHLRYLRMATWKFATTKRYALPIYLYVTGIGFLAAAIYVVAERIPHIEEYDGLLLSVAALCGFLLLGKSVRRLLLRQTLRLIGLERYAPPMTTKERHLVDHFAPRYVPNAPPDRVVRRFVKTLLYGLAYFVARAEVDILKHADRHLVSLRGRKTKSSRETASEA